MKTIYENTRKLFRGYRKIPATPNGMKTKDTHVVDRS